MFKFLISDNDPVVLIITPLKECNTISSKTIDSVMGTSVPINWISYSSDQNPYKNFDCALTYYLRFNVLPKYILKLDNDIDAKSNMIDMMVKTLDSSPDNVAYTYCDFKFEGSINALFKAAPFSEERLMKSNYISSISLMKSESLRSIGGVVTNDKYFRLLDWALWLKFLGHGYVGVPTYDTSFIANASEKSISNGSHTDYVEKYRRVYSDFILPMHSNIQDQNLF